MSPTEAPQIGRFKWSASRLKRLLQCPRQFRYVYLDGLPTLVTAPLVFGQTMHEVICRAHEAQMESGQLPPLSELLPRFDALWEQALEEQEPLFRPSHPTPERYATTGHEMLRVFHAGNRDSEAPLAVEAPFEIEVEMRNQEGVGAQGSETVMLRGVIDRLDEVRLASGESALVVVDYKSGQKKPSAFEVEEGTQLTVYALAASQWLGLPVERVEIHFLRDGLTLPSQRHQSSLDWLRRQVLPYAQSTLERGHFPPSPGYWCRYCDFSRQCQEENARGDRR
jgi:ATP-dependent helicase/DNAse subunit B